MWYTRSEIDHTDELDPRKFEARKTDDGRYVIWSSEFGDPFPIGLPIEFDGAVAIIRWIREGGLRDYRRGIVESGFVSAHLKVELIDDLATVPTDPSGLRGQVVFDEHNTTMMSLGPDLPVQHAAFIVDWLREDDTLAA